MAVFDKRQGNVQSVIAELIRRLNDNSKRLRLVEQKTLNAEAGVANIDQSVLEQFKQVKSYTDKLNVKIEDLGNRISKLEDDSRKMSKQLERTSTKTELREVQGFIDLINPMKSEFITRAEVKRMLEDAKKQALQSG